MEELKTFLLRYSQPRRSHPNGESVIWEKKEQTISAPNFAEARRDAYLFLQQGWVQISEEESHGRRETSFAELSILKESTPMLTSFRDSLIDDTRL